MKTVRAAFLFLCMLALGGFTHAQDLEKRPAGPAPMAQPNGPAKAPNADPMYQQLRNIGIGPESTSVTNFVLKRDAGEFTFRSGSFQFLPPVNGKVTGAVFTGDGSFAMVPPIWSERRSISLLTKEQAIHEDFSVVVLRFTDGTYDEIKKAGGISTSVPSGTGELDSVKHGLRKKIQFNLDARILQDVMSGQPGGLFYAFIKGKKYDSKEIFAIDPHGVEEFAPEEVVFETWDENKYGVWSCFHYSDEYKNGTASGTQRNSLIAIDQQNLDTQMEKNGKLNGDAQTNIVALQDGVQVVPLRLFPTLRVSSASNAAGEQLGFIQEGKDDDPDFSVILPKPLKKGESYLIRTKYSGKEAVLDEGSGNYFPVAREDWFPNTNEGNYASYNMTFRIPKNLMMVATGNPIKSANEGNQNISEWKSEVPQTVAGFSVGSFKHIEATDKGITSEAYANTDLPDNMSFLQHAASGDFVPGGHSAEGVTLGTLDTTVLMKKALAEAQLSMQIYTDYFGPSQYKRVAMTQQTACTFGQSWPTLIYMPICYFYDTTVRHQLGLDDPRGYWQVVGPHEVAHQWWGHTVGFDSYRDQWMSEGFAELSASIFIQMVRGNQKFLDFWKDERELLTEKNRMGFRAIDVGPVTVGYRLNNSKAGVNVTRNLIYPKGGYILHMVRMMMYDRQNGDRPFRDMMHDFVATYRNKNASTEDFKAMVEKHMTPIMNLDGNHKMDWFFNEYVYGTELPTYSFEQSIDDKMNLKIKLTQGNVAPNFKMLVPVYLELANSNVVKLGMVPIAGNNTVEQTVPLGQLKERPHRAIMSYYDDVLALEAK